MNGNESSNGSELAIEISGLTKRFGNTLAIDNLSLAVERGSTFGPIGPNGAGKRTTIRMLMGLLTPIAGTVRELGREVCDEPIEIKQRAGYVPEELNPRSSTTTSIAASAQCAGIERP